MTTDIFQVPNTYWDPTTESLVKENRYTDLGPGMPDDPDQYIGDGENPGNVYDPPRDFETIRRPRSPGRVTGGIADGGDVVIVSGTDPAKNTGIGDGTASSVSTGLDVVVHEGLYIADGEALTQPSSVAQIDESGAGTSWTNLATIQTGIEGAPDTSITLGNDATSKYLNFSGFKLDIPQGAVLTGITANVNREVVSGSLASEEGGIYRCADQLQLGPESTILAGHTYGIQPNNAFLAQVGDQVDGTITTDYRLTNTSTGASGYHTRGVWSPDDSIYVQTGGHANPWIVALNTSDWSVAYNFSGHRAWGSDYLPACFSSDGAYFAYHAYTGTEHRIKVFTTSGWGFHRTKLATSGIMAMVADDTYLYVAMNSPTDWGSGNAYDLVVFDWATMTEQGGYAIPDRYGFGGQSASDVDLHPVGNELCLSYIIDTTAGGDWQNEYVILNAGTTPTEKVILIPNPTTPGQSANFLRARGKYTQGDGFKLFVLFADDTGWPNRDGYVRIYNTTDWSVDKTYFIENDNGDWANKGDLYVSNRGSWAIVRVDADTFREINVNSDIVGVDTVFGSYGDYNNGIRAMPT